VSFGMTIETLAERQIETLGIKEKGGVRVIEVEPNSFAEDIRLQKGDVIIAIAGSMINNIEDVKKVQATLKPGDAVQVPRPAPRSAQFHHLDQLLSRRSSCRPSSNARSARGPRIALRTADPC